MSILDWPTPERPREKLLQHSPSALSDAELLAIFLRTGIPGKTAVDMARDLLTEFHSFRSLFEAPAEQFCRVRGLGMAKYAQLQAILEMMQRYFKESLQNKPIFPNSQATKRYVMSALRGYQQEVFACLFLDNQHHMICFEKLFYGTINCVSVHPREVIKKALQHSAAAVIFAHNHPSGDPHPSFEDKAMTKKLGLALELIDVRLLDHLIIGEKSVTSFAELGLL
ncbi:MAG: DNA repair protein RadC [Gammaproteobacteria bacterium]